MTKEQVVLLMVEKINNDNRFPNNEEENK